MTLLYNITTSEVEHTLSSWCRASLRHGENRDNQSKDTTYFLTRLFFLYPYFMLHAGAFEP